MLKHTHYIEQFRQKNRTLVVNGPIQEIKNLPASLRLTKASNCITIAVFKIRFIDTYNDIPDSVGGGYKKI